MNENFLNLNEKDQLVELSMNKLSLEELESLYKDLMLSKNPNIKTVMKLKEKIKKQKKSKKNISKEQFEYELINALITLTNYKSIFTKKENKELINKEFEYILNSLDLSTYDIEVLEDFYKVPVDIEDISDLAFKIIGKSNFMKNMNKKSFLFESLDKDEREEFLNYIQEKEGLKITDTTPYFHGTPYIFKDLKNQKEHRNNVSNLNLEGIHFSKNPEVARDYALSLDEQSDPNIFTSFIVVKNIKDFENIKTFSNQTNKFVFNLKDNEVIVIKNADNGSYFADELIVDKTEKKLVCFSENEWLQKYRLFMEQSLLNSLKDSNISLKEEANLNIKENFNTNTKQNKMQQ